MEGSDMAADSTSAPTINREALHAWVDRQIDKVMTTPIPDELAGLGSSERLTPDEVTALWYGAGLASQIGMALALEPGQWVTPWPETDEDEEAAAGHAEADALND